MIKVLVILIVLVLSGIFAYLAAANRDVVSSPRPSGTVEPQTNTKTESEAEEPEQSPELEQSPEPEPAPEPEDPGTCELTGDWSMTDECNADGTAIFTQAYKESKPGACPVNEKARVKPCCYQKGDWKDISQCDQGGRKTQEQTTVNCASDLKTRRVDCPYVGEWKKAGECNANGKQTYTRIVVNSAEPVGKDENCCYVGPWGGWGAWGRCDGSKRYRTRNRTVVNCPVGTATTDTGSENCNHCQGYWGGYVWGPWTGPHYCNTSKSRTGKSTYYITKGATNGGNACPHQDGAQLSKTETKRNPTCPPLNYGAVR